MIREQIDAAMLRIPFDLLLDDVRIVNSFTGAIQRGCAGIRDGRIVYVGPRDGAEGKAVFSGQGRYLLPGFVDAHMHLESSMLSPHHFAAKALTLGTTTVAADPHEVCNVLGVPGVKALKRCAEGLPFRVLMMAPSTVPSAPGLEGSGCEIGAEEARRMLSDEDFSGLGEVMDFYGVAAGDEKMAAILEAARASGKLVDGHASLLTGRALQAFRAAGIDSDHTIRTPEKLLEALSLGFCAQVQGCMLTREMVQAMANAPAQENICLVTDDVSLPTLMEKGQLNAVFEKAVALGLDPIRAVRYTTLNPARRLRLYDIGAVVPGMRADLQLVSDLRAPRPCAVWFGGRQVADENGLLFSPAAPKEAWRALENAVRVPRRYTEKDFELRFGGPSVKAHVIVPDGKTSHTAHAIRKLNVKDGVIETAGLTKMAVVNRYGVDRRGLALIEGFPRFRGAAALTYGHDCHNLTVYGTNDGDMALAVNALAASGGGLCAVRDGKVLCFVPLPLAGLMSREEPEEMYRQLQGFLRACREMGFVHEDLMMFMTLMPLAVSPDIKCTDRGLVDVKAHRIIPLLEKDEREEAT